MQNVKKGRLEMNQNELHKNLMEIRDHFEGMKNVDSLGKGYGRN